MRTIALRFGETFSPPCGTIHAHQEVIEKYGYVWYGKLGNRISNKVAETILANENPRVLLIRSGRFERYWAYINDISYNVPLDEAMPQYYKNTTREFKCWFKVVRIEKADNNIMSQCIVPSSNSSLSEASKYSMSPYFIIDYKE